MLVENIRTKIGLEIHGYLNMAQSGQKLFCNCAIEYEAEPNTNICPVCTAQPGCKPMLPNKEAVEKTIKAGLILRCKINRKLIFQRKHYSWPDLPSGYQRTMSGSYSVPVGENGFFQDIRIREVHLEEDPARWDPVSGKVDYNRSGFPLIEIVTEPDFKSSEEVTYWLKELIKTLGYIRAIDKYAGIKSDVNISIYPDFNRVEVKNVNSIKNIANAICYEIKRQQEEVREGRIIHNETRAFDDDSGRTNLMRKKESASDYMFIPEPDLPCVKIDDCFINELITQIPESPEIKYKKFIEKFKIDKDDAEVLSKDIVLADLFEKVAKQAEPNLVARWLRRELMRVVNYNDIELDELKINDKHLIDLLNLITEKKITEKIGQKIMEKLIVECFDVKDYVDKRGLGSISDISEIEKVCKKVLIENPSVVEDYKKGKETALNFLVGQVMKQTKGKANAKDVKDLFKKTA